MGEDTRIIGAGESVLAIGCGDGLMRDWSFRMCQGRG